MKNLSIDIERLDWDKSSGLIPAIIQDSRTFEVLMLGYMNKNSLKQTCELGKIFFYSRTKKRLWEKGETSGNTLTVISISPDCDNDALLVLVKPNGPTCHLGNCSCFGVNITTNMNIFYRLERVIEQRYKDRPENSYLSELFNNGTQRIAQKVGEEGVEVALAGVSGSTQSLINESADLLFHLLVLLKQNHINFSEVMIELENRMTK